MTPRSGAGRRHPRAWTRQAHGPPRGQDPRRLQPVPRLPARVRRAALRGSLREARVASPGNKTGSGDRSPETRVPRVSTRNDPRPTRPSRPPTLRTTRPPRSSRSWTWTAPSSAISCATSSGMASSNPRAARGEGARWPRPPPRLPARRHRAAVRRVSTREAAWPAARPAGGDRLLALCRAEDQYFGRLLWSPYRDHQELESDPRARPTLPRVHGLRLTRGPWWLRGGCLSIRSRSGLTTVASRSRAYSST